MAPDASQIAVVAPDHADHIIVEATPPVTSQSTGFINYDIFGFHISVNPMFVLLIIVSAVVCYFFWKGQRDKGRNTFDGWDLVMDALPNGGRRASGIKVAFQICFLVSTWVVIDKELKNSLDAAFFAVYSGVWAASLIGKIVFDQKTMPDLKDVIKGSDA
jgi:hypothetical protein